jgi:soluble lytic murein transglycosylase
MAGYRTPVIRQIMPFRRLLVGFLLCAGLGHAHTRGLDADFLAARDAYRADDAAKLDKLAPRLAGHVLEPYVAYWQLQLSIDAAEPDAVRAFLGRYKDTLLADRLRTEWLKSLAARGAWAQFGAEYPSVQTEDTELACYGLQYRRQFSDEVLAEARPVWFSGQDTPGSCAPLFDEMFARGQLGNADVWRRFRLAAEADNKALAVRLNGALDEKQRIPARQLELAMHDPERVLAKPGLPLNTQAGRELVLYALLRHAQTSPLSARDYWLRLREQVPAGDAAYGNAQVAFFAARKLLPEALQWYRELGVAPLSDLQLAWKARVALRAQAWPDVLAAIAAMSRPAQQEAAWRYWKARALIARGDAAADGDAQPILALLAQESHYYGLLAAEDLGRNVAVSFESVKADADAVRGFERNQAVQRALKLFELDLRGDGVREWAWAIRNLDDGQLLVAAEVARRNAVYDRAISTADKTALLHDYRLRYLAPYQNVFAAAARTHRVDEALVLGVVRQESRFVADALSSAGATGLMQLMPATAKWVARQLGRRNYRSSQIGAINVNIEFGTYYLHHVLNQLDGLPVLAAAAYNAGPGRAQAWRAQGPLEGAIYVESIPLNETRDYVKKVLANSVFYARLLGQTDTSLKRRLGVIPPRNGEAKIEDVAMEEKTK